MYARRTIPLAVAAAALAAGLGHAAPAAASVTYDPRAMSGYAGVADVRKAFGWSDAVLAARAGGLVFNHEFSTTDTYAVWCGTGPSRVEHPRDYGRFELTDAVIREPRRGSRTGYGGLPRTVGFRITGPHAGISGTSVPPTAGQPCPDARGPKITRADLLSTTTGWSLTVSSGTVSKVLRAGR